MNQPAECCEQGEVLIDRLEDHVKRCQQCNTANTVDHVASKANTEECFVVQDIPSGFSRITGDDEAGEDTEIDRNHGDERDRESDSCDPRSHAL